MSTDIVADLRAAQAEVHRLKCENEFKEEAVLYRVSDWLRSVGQPELANRIDPREGDTIRRIQQQQTQQLADDLKAKP